METSWPPRRLVPVFSGDLALDFGPSWRQVGAKMGPIEGLGGLLWRQMSLKRASCGTQRRQIGVKKASCSLRWRQESLS